MSYINDSDGVPPVPSTVPAPPPPPPPVPVVPEPAPEVPNEIVTAPVAASKKSVKTRPTLRVGSRGGHVNHLQAKLGNLKADGLFAEKTEAAVEAFQSANGLVSDGVVGPETWAKIG